MNGISSSFDNCAQMGVVSAESPWINAGSCKRAHSTSRRKMNGRQTLQKSPGTSWTCMSASGPACPCRAQREVSTCNQCRPALHPSSSERTAMPPDASGFGQHQDQTSAFGFGIQAALHSLQNDDLIEFYHSVHGATEFVCGTKLGRLFSR